MSPKERFIRVALSTLGHIPLPIARATGNILGRLCLALATRGARVTKKNIDLCFPQMTPKDKSKLVTKSMVETGRLAFEVPVVWKRPIPWLLGKVDHVVGEGLFTSALKQERGLIVLAPHIGNWELFGAFFSQYDATICLYQPPKQAFLEQLITQSREKTGIEMVPTDKRGVAKLLRALGDGRATFILPDQCPQQGSGDFSSFFGNDAYTMTLVNGLVKRTGCQVLMGFFLRTRSGFTLHFVQAEPGIGSQDKAEGLRALNASVEKCVLMKPEQYQWEYKRFRMRRSEDAADIYA